MTARNWLGSILCTVAAAFLFLEAAAWAVDPYGVWRDPAGRQLQPWGSDRKSKFFLSMRYIPANFDGLVLGASESLNWTFNDPNGLKLYIESMGGANAVEEYLISRQTLNRQHFKVVILVLASAMTKTGEVHEGLGSTQIVEAAISIRALINEVTTAASLLDPRLRMSPFAPDGHSGSAHNVLFHFSRDQFKIDDRALQSLQATVAALRARGVLVIYVVPPIYQTCYDETRSEEDAYLADIIHALPSAPVMNFLSPSFAVLRADQANFFDCVHPTAVGSTRISASVAHFASSVIGDRIAEPPRVK